MEVVESVLVMGWRLRGVKWGARAGAVDCWALVHSVVPPAQHRKTLFRGFVLPRH